MTLRALLRSAAVVLVPLGIWLLFLGVGNLGGEICSDRYGCMSGGPVIRFALSELILGSLLLLLAASSVLHETGRGTNGVRITLLSLFPFALLFLLFSWAASSPQLNY